MTNIHPPKPVKSALDLIGNTPMVELTQFDTGPCRLFVKLENQNPGGSIKDRIGKSMIEAAEKDGKLKPGGLIVEATAGNTGLGLAQVGILKGYKLILIVPDKMAREKIQHLRAMGVDVRITRSDVGKGHPDYYQDVAARIAEETGAFYVNQFANPANPLAHETTTGPEIWEQMQHDVDAVPPNCDLDLVKKAYAISDKESIETARALLSKEGILGGSSSGTLLAAALRYCREQTTPKRVVTLVPDNGNKYLSKVYNDYWVIEQGLSSRNLKGNLSDLIARTHDTGGTVTVGPDDTLMVAYSRMRANDVSQVPVVVDGRIVGILDEHDILAHVEGHEEFRAQQFKDPVRCAMTARLKTVQVNDKLEALPPIFERNEVAIVCDGEKFVGLITRIDLINHLRLSK